MSGTLDSDAGTCEPDHRAASVSGAPAPDGPPDVASAAPIRARIVVLASGSGTLLQALLDATADPAYGVEIAAVGTDRPGVVALERAEAAGIPTFTLRVPDFATREEWDAALAETVASYNPGLVVSAGFLKLVGSRFLARFGGRYLNSHNALLPAFPGMHAPRDAVTYGVKVSGATLFVVDEGVDSGAVIAQCVVPVHPDDDADSLSDRIKEAERPQLVEYVGRMAREGFTVAGRTVSIP